MPTSTLLGDHGNDCSSKKLKFAAKYRVYTMNGQINIQHVLAKSIAEKSKPKALRRFLCQRARC